MDMIDGVPTADFDVLDSMWSSLSGSVDEGDESRIGTQVDNIAENTQVTDSLTIGGCNKTYWPEPT
jgi:hypothetical protein